MSRGDFSPTVSSTSSATSSPPSRSTRRIFITGTDTEVGKTYVTSAMARALRAAGMRVGAYKPLCSGAVQNERRQWEWPDIEALWQALGGAYPRDRICPQRFLAPLAPPIAAREENRSISDEELVSGCDWWNGRVDWLLVEGVGGLLCPITETRTVADLAAEFGDPLLVVSRLGLGTINHTLLTVEAAQSRGLPVAGIVLNQGCADDSDPSTNTNPAEIAARTDVPVWGIVARNQTDGLLRVDRSITMDWVTFFRERLSDQATASTLR